MDLANLLIQLLNSVQYGLLLFMLAAGLLHKMSEAQVRKEATAHALVWERTASTLPWQHVVIFRKK